VNENRAAKILHYSQFRHGSEPTKRPLQFRSRDFQSRLLWRDWKSRLRAKNCKDDLAYNEPCQKFLCSVQEKSKISQIEKIKKSGKSA
jgi:hypothetical protein